MRKKATYLSERVYIRNGKEDIYFNFKRSEYWMDILGEKLLKEICNQNANVLSYLKNGDYSLSVDIKESEILQYLSKKCIEFPLDIAEILKERVAFEPFYAFFVEFGISNLKNELQGLEDSFELNIYDDFKYYLAEQLQAICMRTLIVEMQDYKMADKLHGKDEKEEYEYFCTENMCNPTEIINLMEKYPVLCRCVEDRINNSVCFYKEIIEHFCNDKKEIAEHFCPENQISRITNITTSYSDVHQKGRQVVKIEIDKKMKILYKPHSMENEKAFMSLLQWISQGIGITQLNYEILTHESYSWCSIVKYRECESKEEICNYYKRLGTQLFLAYFLGTHDLHCENIIASGEYPVLIDLETLVGGFNSGKRKTAEDEVYYHLQQSVLSTGLLPTFMWDKGGNGIDVSGMSGGNEATYPFKIPVIMNPKTSNMRIGYDYPQATLKENRVKLRGEFCPPVKYEAELLNGFSVAYRYVIENREEFKRQVKLMTGLKSRFLFSDTQRYGMTLSSSYHPSLLQDGAEREIFLMSMWKGRGVDKKTIVEDEIQSLLQGDIPYFEYYLGSKNLYSGTGKIWKNFFDSVPITFLLNKIDQLSEKDMIVQERYIQTALELTPENRDNYENKVYAVDSIKSHNREREDISSSVNHLIDRLIEEAIWNDDKTEVSWCQINFNAEKNMVWHMTPMNMYLYNGLAGMLLIFYELNQSRKEQKIIEIYKTIKNMLFAYTEGGRRSLESIQSNLIGMYDGESSIIYTYLILYQQSKDKQYLYYAEEHSTIVEQLIDKSQKYDLLSGNAGAAQVLLKLYEVSGKNKYLTLAEKAITRLQEHKEKQNQGIGWRIREDIPPMSGMAHGNAGILMPVFTLWKKTGKEKYKQLAEEIWEYEESLYDVDIGNWIDVRNTEKCGGEVGAMAWCHGAAGILLLRLYCNELTDAKLWKERFAKDINRAYKILKKYWIRDSWSLCHGICGNLWILELIDIKEKNNFIYEYAKYLKSFKLLPQELLNPGFMNGYGGIIYSILSNYIPYNS